MKFFTTTHPVIPDGKTVYIQTPSLLKAQRFVSAQEHLHLLGGRQNGKTSTLMSLSNQLEIQGHLCLHLNMVTYSNEATLKKAMAEIWLDLCDQLALTKDLQLKHPQDIAHQVTAMMQHIARYQGGSDPIYLFIDELDALLKYPPAEVADFLVGLRTFVVSERRHRFTILTASVMELDGISRAGLRAGRNQTTFGAILPLKGFPKDKTTVVQLLEGFPENFHRSLKSKLLKVLQWTNGHPQLTMTFCTHLLRFLEEGLSVNKACQTTLHQMPDFSRGHLTAIKDQLISRKHEMPPILHAYEDIRRAELRGEPKRITEPSNNQLYLETIGLVQRNLDDTCTVSNELYRQVISDVWINDLLTQHYNVYQYRRRSRKNRAKPKVGMIFTGGTIGMRIEHDQAVFRMEWVRETVADDLEHIATMQFQFLEAKDGVNMHPSDWFKLIETIQRMRPNNQAMIVAHGTDTLAFSACALAFAFGRNLDFPIILTGSQCTLDVIHGDARQNLVRSCRVAEKAIEDRVHEVMICFDDQVYKATRTLKVHDQRFRGFASYTWPLMAQVAEEITFNPAARLNRESKQTELAKPQAVFCDSIVFINIVPGLKEEIFSQLLTGSVSQPNPQDLAALPPVEIDGIILATPGAGNIPSKDIYNFLLFIEKVTASGIPVLINSQVPIDPLTYLEYRAASEPVQRGAIFGGNMTPAAALTKFSWAIANLKAQKLSGQSLIKELRTLMETNIVDEIDTQAQGNKSGVELNLWHTNPQDFPSLSVAPKRKVAVIMTGGTIGMIHDGTQYQFDIERISNWMKPDLEPMAEIVVESYGPKDGIDMNHHDWCALYDLIQELRQQGADAIVISHGTDTLAYTACALGFAYGNSLDFPIVFTGAQSTLDRPQGDTRINLIRAVYTAVEACEKEQRINEVMLVFHEEVLRAARCEKVHDEHFNGFASPAWPELATITDRFKINRNAIRNTPVSGSPPETVRFADNILYINIVPGLKMKIYQKFLDFETPFDGIILASPGAGNIPNEGEYNFHEFLRLTQVRRIPVLITSQVPVSPPIDYSYKVASEPIEAYGAIYAVNMTQAAALTKFAYVIEKQKQLAKTKTGFETIKTIEILMKTPIIGEAS